ncbi:MAG: Tol-Pal system beta propeller repeat protein TolB [Candidatus Latescibacteria bacterium]|nr:Tol-Pal system beta propeller repeat protein TolB [Candidatus Latescibacterota bacterium]
MLILFPSFLFAQQDTTKGVEAQQDTTKRAEVHLGIKIGGFRKIPIALTGFDAEIGDILTADLTKTGSFRVVHQPVPDTGSASTKRVEDRWRMAGAQSLARGEIQENTGHQTVMTSLFDLTPVRSLFFKEYPILHQAAKRMVAHRVADDIIEALTGERGISTTRIACVGRGGGGHKEVYIVDYDGYNYQQITNDRSISLSPAWSPDGREIAYTSSRDGNWYLYVVDVERRTSQPLSTRPGLNSAPAWSPDGSRIAYSMTIDGNSEIYVINRDRSGLRRLTYDPGIDTSPTWSPDSRSIAFTSNRSGTPKVYVMDADGGSQRGLIWGSEAYEDSPAWSPKGDRVAYVVLEGEGFNIYTVDVEGEVPIRLTADSGSNEDPSWSPDGLHITFSSTRGGTSEIYTMGWDGSDQQRLTSSGGCSSPSWSPRF